MNYEFIKQDGELDKLYADVHSLIGRYVKTHIGRDADLIPFYYYNCISNSLINFFYWLGSQQEYCDQEYIENTLSEISQNVIGLLNDFKKNPNEFLRNQE